MSDVDVIVLDVDGGPMLEECLASIRAQTVPPPASSSSTTARATPVRRAGVDVIRSETNLGFAGGANAAFRHASARRTSRSSTTTSCSTATGSRTCATRSIATKNSRPCRRSSAAPTARSTAPASTSATARSGRSATGSRSGRRSRSRGASPRPRRSTAASALGERMFDERFFAYYEDVELSRAPARRRLAHGRPAGREGDASRLRQRAASSARDALRLRTRNRYLVARMHPRRRDASARCCGKMRGSRCAGARRCAASSKVYVPGCSPHARRRRRAHGRPRHPRVAPRARAGEALPDDADRESGGQTIAADRTSRSLDRARHAPKRAAAMRDADVLIGQPARGFRKRRRGQRIVYDLFDPTVLELRELYGNKPSLRQRVHLAAEWWRLVRGAHARRSARLRRARSSASSTSGCRAATRRGSKCRSASTSDEVRACAKPQDNIVVWGGGVWEWLDPATAVDAIVRLNEEGVRAKLLFLGRVASEPRSHRPPPRRPLRRAARARRRARVRE